MIAHRPVRTRAQFDATQLDKTIKELETMPDAERKAVLDRPAFAHVKRYMDVLRFRGQADAAKLDVARARTKGEKTAARRALADVQRKHDAAQAALSGEERAERAATAAQRLPVEAMGENGQTVTLRHPHAARDGAVFRRCSTLLLLHGRNPSVVSRRHVKAGARYEADWEMAGRDSFPTGVSDEARGGGYGSGNRRIEDPAGSAAALDAARKSVGIFGTGVLDHVILQNGDLASWVAGQRMASAMAEAADEGPEMSNKHALGILAMVLERLAEHYEAP